MNFLSSVLNLELVRVSVILTTATGANPGFFIEGG